MKKREKKNKIKEVKNKKEEEEKSLDLKKYNFFLLFFSKLQKFDNLFFAT